MKDPFERTKVVLRHLPPSLTEGDLVEQINAKLASRYKWFCFRPGKISPKNQRYARAYIDFKSPEDVFEFVEFFDGHAFVNEKGTQYKVLVEYAPSQHVPKQWTKKDGREGTILNDPEYIKFLELLAKPAENLPSAEIQLERREAEKAGAAKEVPIVTPLMNFIRQKRAAKSRSERTSGNGKPSRRRMVSCNSSSPSSKRGSEKRRGSTVMHVSKEISKNESVKEKPKYILMSRRDGRLSDKTFDHLSASEKDVNLVGKGSGVNGTVSGVPVSIETGKKTLLLLKGKDREGSQIHGLEAPGRIIRSILSSKEGHQMSTSQSDPQLITGVSEKDKRSRKPSLPRPNLKEHHAGSLATSDADGKSHIETRATSHDSQHTYVSISDKLVKRIRNKDRPDRGDMTVIRTQTVRCHWIMGIIKMICLVEMEVQNLQVMEMDVALIVLWIMVHISGLAVVSRKLMPLQMQQRGSPLEEVLLAMVHTRDKYGFKSQTRVHDSSLTFCCYLKTHKTIRRHRISVSGNMIICF